MKSHQISNLAIFLSLMGICGVQGKPVEPKIPIHFDNGKGPTKCFRGHCFPRQKPPKLDRRIDEESSDTKNGLQTASNKVLEKLPGKKDLTMVNESGTNDAKLKDENDNPIEVPKVKPPLVLEKDKIPDHKPKLEARDFLTDKLITIQRRSESGNDLKVDTGNEKPRNREPVKEELKPEESSKLTKEDVKPVEEGKPSKQDAKPIDISEKSKEGENIGKDTKKPEIPGESGVPDAPHPKL